VLLAQDYVGVEVPTHQAHRILKARRIIRDAYGQARARQALRFELLGESVAIAVVPEDNVQGSIRVKVARVLPDGRVSRMLKESRIGFTSIRDQICYFETLYKRYGDPQ
jgi:hypothetical protein